MNRYETVFIMTTVLSEDQAAETVEKLRKFLKECEPSIDLNRTVTAPSGEKVTFELSFGVEFFRPFFSI